MPAYPGSAPLRPGRGLRPRRTRAAALLAPALCAALLCVGVAGAPPAAAAGEGGATTRVTRDGRIVTWILFPESRRGRPGAGSPSRETWVVLSDAEISFLVHLVAARPDLLDDPLVAALAAAVGDGSAEGASIQLLVRDGRPTTQVRAVPSDTAGSADPTVIARRMVTVLPRLAPTLSPPAAATVPVATPVFVSFAPDQWQRRVDRTLSAGDVVARVRAWPESFRVGSGDPSDVGRVLTCVGPGHAYDPTDPAAPTAQARRPGTCAPTYRTATGVRGRRDTWYGDLTVLWRAEWSTDGVTWLPLGLIPRVSVLSRSVSELGTAIARPRGG